MVLYSDIEIELTVGVKGVMHLIFALMVKYIVNPVTLCLTTLLTLDLAAPSNNVVRSSLKFFLR